jgi:hypothetical protein
MALAAVVALAVPLTATAAVSQTDVNNAAKFCKALRVDMKAGPFKLAYGTNQDRSNAYGKCVSKFAKVEDQNHTNAAKECKAEKALNEADFIAKYGGKRNAFGKCVSQKEDQAEEQDHDAIVNASKQCRAERAKNAADFRDKYGTNRNKRNAFGKCVSKLAREHESQGS